MLEKSNRNNIKVKKIPLSDIQLYAELFGVETHGRTAGEVIKEIIDKFAIMSEEEQASLDMPGKTLAEIHDSLSNLRALSGTDTRKMSWDCEGPLVHDCAACEGMENCLRGHLKWYSRLPHFVVDNYIRKLSPSAFKIFVYLNRRAQFEERKQHYGKCWLTHTEISEATGVKASNMAKYLKELQRQGLIEYSWSRIGSPEGVKTIHAYTITWLKALQRLKDKAKADAKKASEKWSVE